MTSRISRTLPRLLAVAVLFQLTFLLGCGGDAGIDNGNIVGKVFANFQDGSSVRAPLEGADVVLQRDGEPKIIRSTVTDSNGQYVFREVPVNEYAIGVAKAGYLPITTEEGATSQRSAVGSQIRVLVESGATSVAADATLTALEPSGDATLIVEVLDDFTGQPVKNATVQVGLSAVSDNTNGVYTVKVPLTSNGLNRLSPDTLYEVRLTVTAEGFTDSSIRQSVLPDNVVSRTIILSSTRTVQLLGTAVPASNAPQNLLQLLGTDPQLRVRDSEIGVTPIPRNGGGAFTIRDLPRSTDFIARTIDLEVTHPDLETVLLQRVSLPKGGSRTLTNPIILTPKFVSVVGQVSVGANQGVPNGPDDRVLIIETGQEASLVNGTFVIPRVVTQQGPSAPGYTLQVEATDPSTNKKFCETVSDVKPISDGTSNPTFRVAQVVAAQECGGGAAP